MQLKDFEKFLEEITIKDNPAIPGEGDDKGLESGYLTDVEKRAKEKIGITGAQSTSDLGVRLTSLLAISNEFVAEESKKKALVKLAEDVMIDTYGWILDRYDIDLDIQFIKGSQISSFMEESENEEMPEAEIEFKEVTDEDLLREIHKRKIANLIIQGEAKNTKHILHSQVVKNGLNKIYGSEKAGEIFKVWDEMSKIADKLDWLIPTSARSKAMEMNPDGFSGACGFGWKKTEKQTQIEIEDEEEYGEWTGEFDEEEMYSEESYEDFNIQEEVSYTPILRARGVDFPMLLHESVKGLFEILSLGGIPSDPRAAKVVVSETGISDEPEDWKYGPEIAKDFREFINKNSKVFDYPNVKEELFKILIDKKTMPTEEFLELFKGILVNIEKSEEILKRGVEIGKITQEVADKKLQELKLLKSNSRKKIDRFIDDIVANIEAWQNYYDEKEKYEKELAEYERKMAEWEEWKATQVEEEEEEEETPTVTDYSKMSQREIQELIDDALARRDFTTVKMLSPYLKEGKEIYLREIEMILENKKPHHY